MPFVQTAILKDNKLIHFDSYGHADIKSKKEVNDYNIYRIASMTKPIISVAVMILVEKGYLKLEDPISKHMRHTENLMVYKNKNEFKKPEMELRVIDLLNHTSGLGYAYGEINSLIHPTQKLRTQKLMRNLLKNLIFHSFIC